MPPRENCLISTVYSTFPADYALPRSTPAFSRRNAVPSRVKFYCSASSACAFLPSFPPAEALAVRTAAAEVNNSRHRNLNRSRFCRASDKSPTAHSRDDNRTGSGLLRLIIHLLPQGLVLRLRGSPWTGTMKRSPRMGNYQRTNVHHQPEIAIQAINAPVFRIPILSALNSCPPRCFYVPKPIRVSLLFSEE